MTLQKATEPESGSQKEVEESLKVVQSTLEAVKEEKEVEKTRATVEGKMSSEKISELTSKVAALEAAAREAEHTITRQAAAAAREEAAAADRLAQLEGLELEQRKLAASLAESRFASQQADEARRLGEDQLHGALERLHDLEQRLQEALDSEDRLERALAAASEREQATSSAHAQEVEKQKEVGVKVAVEKNSLLQKQVDGQRSDLLQAKRQLEQRAAAQEAMELRLMAFELGVDGAGDDDDGDNGEPPSIEDLPEQIRPEVEGMVHLLGADQGSEPIVARHLKQYSRARGMEVQNERLLSKATENLVAVSAQRTKAKSPLEEAMLLKKEKTLATKIALLKGDTQRLTSKDEAASDDRDKEPVPPPPTDAAIMALLERIKVGNAAAVHDLAKMTSHREDEAIRKRVTDAGAVPALAPFMTVEDPRAVEGAALVLSHLARSKANRLLIGEVALSALVDMLERPMKRGATPEEKAVAEAATATLINIIHEVDENRLGACQLGVVKKVSGLLSLGGPMSKLTRNVVILLRSLFISKDVRETAPIELVASLVEVIGANEDSKILTNSVWVLSSLSQHGGPFQAAAAETDIVEWLVSHVQPGMPPPIMAAAAAAIANLAFGHRGNSSKLVETASVAPLMRLFRVTATTGSKWQAAAFTRSAAAAGRSAGKALQCMLDLYTKPQKTQVKALEASISKFDPKEQQEIWFCIAKLARAICENNV
ncbi:hypothetical protein CYMTET_16653 [Cymbomonas tetramitiformis]|uniref:Uncharacterized protein n=1 Tax=Cymbomonas tetramitiformis TaxID=36881 RepID=A0AAE0GBS0_9CHLO|nr:hypothetical protein CYMTET_16653 [Cymbomonas tetramitiformis]